MEEYIVTLHKHEDLDEFYNDIETPGGSLYIPNREVETIERRRNSRNTHYMLTAEEAEEIKNDARVWDVVSLAFIESAITEPLGYTQYSANWDKSDTADANDCNWGLLRCIEGYQTTNWGTNSGFTNRTATITNTISGRNVDVIILDGLMDPGHPEFAVNSDGTGGSKMVKFDWDLYTAEASGITISYAHLFNFPNRGKYAYRDTLNSSYGDDHGMHVAGTVAGNTQGWARHANIYNLNPFSTENTQHSSYYGQKYDYIRAFHKFKPINPATGIKNPTIVNGSFGSAYLVSLTNMSVNFRGNTVTTNAAAESYAQLRDWGLNGSIVDNQIYIPAVITSTISDIQDMIAEGVIFVGSGGNSNEVITNSTDTDYNNQASGYYYYCRGDSKKSGGTIISGAIAAHGLEFKALFSAKGPGIDCYAPGYSIQSCVHASGDSSATDKRSDARDTSYSVMKKSGTSMSGPQMSGVLACLAENKPYLTHAQAKAWLHGSGSKKNQIADTSDTTDLSDSMALVDLNGDTNRYLYNDQFKRYSEGGTSVGIPVLNHERTSSGFTYPRVKLQTRHIKQFGNWYTAHIGGYDPDTTSGYLILSGNDRYGEYHAQNNFHIRINQNDVLSIINQFGSGITLMIATTAASNATNHSDVIQTPNYGLQFHPQTTGTYYYLDPSNHTKYVGTITVGNF